MKTIIFRTNPNLKLDNKYFVHFELKEKFTAGDSIILNYLNKGKIVKVKSHSKIHISKLTDWHCYLSTGRPLEDTLKELYSLYDFDLLDPKAIIHYYLIENAGVWFDLPECNILF